MSELPPSAGAFQRYRGTQSLCSPFVCRLECDLQEASAPRRSDSTTAQTPQYLAITSCFARRKYRAVVTGSSVRHRSHVEDVSFVMRRLKLSGTQRLIGTKCRGDGPATLARWAFSDLRQRIAPRCAAVKSGPDPTPADCSPAGADVALLRVSLVPSSAANRGTTGATPPKLRTSLGDRSLRRPNVLLKRPRRKARLFGQPTGSPSPTQRPDPWWRLDDPSIGGRSVWQSMSMAVWKLHKNRSEPPEADGRGSFDLGGGSRIEALELFSGMTANG